MKTKTFSLRTILTATTGRLLTESQGPRDNGIGHLYELLGWMTDDSPMTHQLGRFSDECKPWLYKWWPELAIAEASLSKLDEWIAKDKTGTAQEGTKMWITELKMMHPLLKDEYEVAQIHVGDHHRKDPVSELIELREGKEGIIIVNPSEP